ncbi:deoxynucleoside triphosphate triphosphohydrolase SAMHD1-like isoform X2 [Stegastes partitus]|uniref:Deoxynucleoside triphosphate triphosphohydrolase SAMHD1-like isoform X2 n=1 Tax=Stegastes partitus TaxID=144197 RepID=A0A9Y4KEH0_9TELE|nr:PREDICTED: deoxynucleoside triphosphate triphosphohydrolase SAMHD1-like isoform X2 [Stegastes partitus]
MLEISREQIESWKVELAQKLSQDKADIVVTVVTLDYGMKKKDPINHTYFYRKNDFTNGFKIPESQKSRLLPTTFSEKFIRVYCKKSKSETDLEEAQEHFRDWCKKKGFPPPEAEAIPGSEVPQAKSTE